VRAALSFLEDHAAFSRTGRGGVIQVDADGFVAAAFTHHTSRAGDPQLHAHVLVANKVRCVDGRWRSLDGREMFAFQKAAGMLYNATLRVELSARLGVEWQPVDRNGQADIEGVPRELIELFSQRRHDVKRRGAQRIATLEARLGRTLTDDERAEQYQFATYDTRPAKTDGDDGNPGRTLADGSGPRRMASRPVASRHPGKAVRLGRAKPRGRRPGGGRRSGGRVGGSPCDVEPGGGR
jgi:conjugative relaxase-like TrwC/TraI family protein